MYRYIGLIAAAAAVLAYFLLQSTPVNIHIKKFIPHDPVSVFKVLKDPNLLTDLHPKVQNVYIERSHVTDANIEYQYFILTEVIPHVGPCNLSVVFISDPSRLEINSRSSLLHGFVTVDLTYKLTEAVDGTVGGTTVEEFSTVHVPYVLARFTNRTTAEIHGQVLNNLEMLMEFVSGNETEDLPIDLKM